MMVFSGVGDAVREERGGEVDNILELVRGKVLWDIALASDKIGLI